MESRYYGRFALAEGVAVEKLILSIGKINDPSARVIGKKEFRKEPGSGCLFINASMKAGWAIDDLKLFFILRSKTIVAFDNIGNQARRSLASFQLVESFFAWMDSCQDSLSVVELGSRARSGNCNRERIPSRHRYTGIDIKAGENVDIVADVHTLSTSIKPGSVDAVFGISVLEHLAMPWKVAIELNRVMRVGARAMFLTHQAWPLHDAPFDFWRYSAESWPCIFNRSSGFKVLEAAVGDAARLLSELQTGDTLFPSDSICYLASSVIVEKTAETNLSWDVPLEEVYSGVYPK